MQKINFEDASIITPSKVTIDGVDYEVKDAQYQGGTDLNAETFNTMQNNIEKALIDIYDAMWPVGRGFIDFTDTDYSNWLGFKWERELVGLTPVGLDTTQAEFNAIGKTGGEKTHKLTIGETPAHIHAMKGLSNSTGNTADAPRMMMGYGTYGNMKTVSSDCMVSAGGNNPHNILQPYKVVAYWKRVK